jgi:hypothetical protein
MKTAPRNHTLVIGGTRGIGRAVVRYFLSIGHVVSVIGRRKPPESRSKRFRHYSLELADLALLSTTLKQLIRMDGRLTNLIFLQRFRGDGDSWHGELQISLTATHTIIESLARCFSQRRNPSIVFVSSNTSHVVAEEQPVAYHAAKAALRQMARYYAATLGPQGIRVNCVTPGTVLKDESRDFYLTNRPIMRLYEHVTPLARMGTSEDLANVIGFLCSSSASFVTGQDIAVDGGLSLLWQESLARKTAALVNPRLSKLMLR